MVEKRSRPPKKLSSCDERCCSASLLVLSTTFFLVQEAHLTTRRSRERLAVAGREVAANIAIAAASRRKADLGRLLDALGTLREAAAMQATLK